MVENIATATKHHASAGSLYDRIAKLYNITFKFNGYGRSLELYLRDHPLPITAGARILDAGCGTGLLTLALLKVIDLPVHIAAVDLSAQSLATAKEAVAEETRREVGFTQANVLALPFADSSFDLIVTSGVLEYVSLKDGLGELARVLAPGGHLLHLPVRPSLASRFLEVLFRFKAHSPQEVEAHTSRYFRIVKNYRFPPLHPIGWTKTAVLAQKV
jgi:ubiquinone/menaquinone biosynthesis C-methylase UbiE